MGIVNNIDFVKMRLTGRVLQNLKGKTAIVTASTDGIGFAAARRLAEDGAKVWISSRKEDNVIQAIDALKADGLNVNGLVCHVSKQKDREILFNSVIEEDEKLDILISNAAVNPTFGPMLDTPEWAWDKIFEVNVKNTFQLIQEAVPYLEETQGNITCVASIAGFQPINMIGAYSVSKTAMIGLVKALSFELAHRDIRINTVCPGVVRTKFAGALVEQEEILASQFAMGRIAEP